MRELAGRDRLLRLAARFGDPSPSWLAIVTLVLGFGALGSFYFLVVAEGDIERALGGVGIYLTGSLGDALLLPPAAAMTAVAYRGLARSIRAAEGSGFPEAAAERLTLVLSGHLVTWLPGLASTAIIIWYHWRYMADPAFFTETVERYGPSFLVPGVYHSLFMVVAVWWLIALLVRAILAGVLLFGPVGKGGDVPEELASAARSAWRGMWGLGLVLTLFTALLYYDRFGLEWFWHSSVNEPAAVLCAILVIPVLVAIWWAKKAWIDPLETSARER